MTYLIRFKPQIEVIETTSKNIQRFIDDGFEVISTLEYRLYWLLFDQDYDIVSIQKALDNCSKRMTERLSK